MDLANAIVREGRWPLDHPRDRFECGIHWAHTDGCLHGHLSAGHFAQLDSGCGGDQIASFLGVGLHVERQQLPRVLVSDVKRLPQKSLQVVIRQSLLLVCHRLGSIDQSPESLLILRHVSVAHLDQSRLIRGLAGVLAQHQIRGGADALGRDDLVRARVLEHPVLVDARLVRERILADNRLVGLHLDPRVPCHHLTRPHDLLGVDGAVHGEMLRPSAQCHHHLLERRVPRSFPEGVERHLHLPRPRLHCCERVGGGETQVVMAVGRPYGLVRVLGVRDAVREDAGVFVGQSVPHRVGQVDRRRARLDDSCAQLHQELWVGAPRVFRRELDVVA
mmetsp:Transcript_22698/g.46249  ORF Transcript_22698/g.46249 Transcript_22698/m.46249 type:complete len:333 (+) Transcript_22698:545-1543(+)